MILKSDSESPWRVSDRFDPSGRVIADRHYNRQKPGTPQFCPPGRTCVLRAPNALWVTSWPYPEFTKHDWAGAWVNSLFRREGGELASDLIRWAVAHTRAKWPDVPDLGMVSFVDPKKVKGKKDPGYCYLMAGFELVGQTKGGLLVWQMLPNRMPSALAVPSDQLVLDL